MAPPTTSTAAPSAASASPAASTPAPAQTPAAAAVAVPPSGDSDSAALLRMLRTNAVTPAKEPASSTSSVSASTAAFTTPTLASRSVALLTASASKATPPSGRRGPGRPKKSESGSKNAAKWDDEVTSLLLKFRYDDMKNAFEGVRNNVEVGECWIQLAQELTRLSGKSFDSHQCQSKLRNLKKTWREMSSSSKVSSSTSPLYLLLSQYLGEDGGKSSRRTSVGGGNGSSNEAVAATDPASGVTAAPRETSVMASRRRSASVGKHVALADEHVGNGVEVDCANTGEDTDDEEHGRQDSSETTSAVTSSTGEEPQAVRAGRVVAAGTTEIVDATPVTRRIRSDSLSSASSESPAAVPAPPAKRQKRSDPASKTAAPTTATVDIAAAAIPTAVTAAVANLGGGRIDSSLLSVASGLRTMMEGVIASKEESSDQQQILAELREHNTLMKTYCDEVSKQTTSLNALIKLLTERVGSSNP